MPAKSPSRPRNRLLTVLSQADFGLLQPHLEALPLDVRKSLEVPNLRIDDVYFPNVGIASVVAVQEKNTRAEVGLVGSEKPDILFSKKAKTPAPSRPAARCFAKAKTRAPCSK